MVDPNIPTPAPKPGVKTSEFWLVVVIIALAFAMVAFHVDYEQVALAAAALATMFYSVSRALVKKG